MTHFGSHPDWDFGIVDMELTREGALNLPKTDLGRRWERIREEITFTDVVTATHGTTDSHISCPFHGRDSNPSFHIYSRTNNAYCFGCPEGQKNYDSVTFVKAIFGYSNAEAIAWLEKEYNLPPLSEEDEDEEDDDDEKEVTLVFSDLAEPYRNKAQKAFLQSLDPDLIREYIEIYFDSMPDRDAEENDDDQLSKVMPLARVLGTDVLETLKKTRFGA